MKYLTVLPLLFFALLVFLLWRWTQLDDRHVVPSPLIAQPVPKFRLPTIDEDSFSDQDLHGEFSLLNVWATWCLACMDEHAELLAIAAQENIAIYGLAYKDSMPSVKLWVNKYGDPYRKLAIDKDGKLAIQWGSYGAPETFLIDPDGIIRYKHSGAITQEIWLQRFLPLIASSKVTESHSANAGTR